MKKETKQKNNEFHITCDIHWDMRMVNIITAIKKKKKKNRQSEKIYKSISSTSRLDSEIPMDNFFFLLFLLSFRFVFVFCY